MSQEKKPQFSNEDDWFSELLSPPTTGEELGPDEQAVSAAGLSHPDDLDIDRIIAETKAEAAAEAVDSEEALFTFPEEAADEPVPAPAEEPAEAPVFVMPNEPVDTPVFAPEEGQAEVPVSFIPEEPAEVPVSAVPEAQDEPVFSRPEEDFAPSDLPELPLLPVEPLPVTDETATLPIIYTEEDEVPAAEETLPVIPVQTPDAFEEFPDPEPVVVPPVILEDPIPEEPAPLPVPPANGAKKADKPAKKKADKPAKRKAAKETPAADTASEEPPRKVRPKWKKGYGLLGIPHILSTVIWLAIVVAIGVSLGRTLWVCAADVLAFGREERLYTVTITADDTNESIAAKLKGFGLIKYPSLFLLYADLTDAQEDIVPGTYTLSTLYDYHALVKSMNSYSSARKTIEVVIPEGYSCAQIFALLEEKGVCKAADLEAYAAEGEIKDYWFLEGVERGHKYCLEGYLFPDTYEFYVGDSAGRVLGKLLGDKVGGFDVRFTDMMKEKLDDLNQRLSKMMKANGYDQDYIDAHQMTFREIVIIASMIEEETTGKDQHDISSVIYNRLTNAGKHPYLNIDATIIYALDGNVDPETGKVKPLTSEDLLLDDPYNTYVYKGLIPGPITNPGIASLLAALDPNDTDYYFYVYNPDTAKHMFAETAAEHDKNVEYVRSLRENDEEN